MIFSQYSYRNFHNGNKEIHPMQPYSWDNWIKMVNDDEMYCKKMNLLKWIELYFWVCRGRVRVWELSSCHEYWHIQMLIKTNKSNREFIDKVEICRKSPSQIKYLFNSNTSIYSLDEEVSKLRTKELNPAQVFALWLLNSK